MTFVACYSSLSLVCLSSATLLLYESLSQADLEVGLAVPRLGRHAAVLRARGREHPLLDAGGDHLQAVGLHRPRPGAPNGSPGFRPVAQRSSACCARGNGGGCGSGAEPWSHGRYERGRGAHRSAEQNCLEHLGLLASALSLSLSTRHAVRQRLTSSTFRWSNRARGRAGSSRVMENRERGGNTKRGTQSCAHGTRGRVDGEHDKLTKQ